MGDRPRAGARRAAARGDAAARSRACVRTPRTTDGAQVPLVVSSNETRVGLWDRS